MRLKVALAAAVLALFGASSAQAQLTLTFTPTSVLTPGADLAFLGTIENISGGTVTVGGVSSTLDATITLIDNFSGGVVSTGGVVSDPGDPLLAVPPITLAPGDTNITDPFFEIILPAGFSGSPLITFTLFSNDPVPVVLGTGSIAAIPEPGQVGLLLSTALTGGLLVARRRRR
jgi:hypothetical protein